MNIYSQLIPPAILIIYAKHHRKLLTIYLLFILIITIALYHYIIFIFLIWPVWFEQAYQIHVGIFSQTLYHH
jgi:hypothetical protein